LTTSNHHEAADYVGAAIDPQTHVVADPKGVYTTQPDSSDIPDDTRFDGNGMDEVEQPSSSSRDDPNSQPTSRSVSPTAVRSPSSPPHGPQSAAPTDVGLRTPERQQKPLVEKSTPYTLKAVGQTPNRVSDFGEYEPSPGLVKLIPALPDPWPVNRLAYSYPESMLVRMDYRTRKMALNQLADDIENTDLCPALAYTHDRMLKANGNMKLFEVESVLTTRTETAILYIKAAPHYVVKYQTNCGYLTQDESRRVVDPILREYWFSEYVDRYTRQKGRGQISPRVFFVSPPTRLVMERTMKTDFAMDDHRRALCVERGANVRFMIMEKTGANMEDFMVKVYHRRKRVEFHVGLEILKQVLLHIKALHTMGIIHGDIHPGNIVRSSSGDRSDIYIIDYGLATFYDRDRPLPEEPIRHGIVNSVWSHWEMRGYTRSFRDDVFRALRVFGQMVGGDCYWQALGEMQTRNGGKDLLYFYESGDLLAPPDCSHHPIHLIRTRELSGEQQQQIFDIWVHILTYVRGITRVNQMLDYDGIVQQIDRIIRRVAPVIPEITTTIEVSSAVSQAADS